MFDSVYAVAYQLLNLTFVPIFIFCMLVDLFRCHYFLRKALLIHSQLETNLSSRYSMFSFFSLASRFSMSFLAPLSCSFYVFWYKNFGINRWVAMHHVSCYSNFCNIYSILAFPWVITAQRKTVNETFIYDPTVKTTWLSKSLKAEST